MWICGFLAFSKTRPIIACHLPYLCKICSFSFDSKTMGNLKTLHGIFTLGERIHLYLVKWCWRLGGTGGNTSGVGDRYVCYLFLHCSSEYMQSIQVNQSAFSNR